MNERRNAAVHIRNLAEASRVKHKSHREQTLVLESVCRWDWKIDSLARPADSRFFSHVQSEASDGLRNVCQIEAILKQRLNLDVSDEHFLGLILLLNS